MVYLQSQIANDKDVLLLSHSVTPDIDSVAQLKKYALEKGVIDKKWNLVTGDKKHGKEWLRIRMTGLPALWIQFFGMNRR